MPQIRQLSASVVNKIAAGEVIERPASVVKELVENAVDAGATRIEVSVSKGGADMIRVTDNGCGIEPEQLELAVTSHATSKILDADDLFSVTSLGFRGEALASIAEVSQFLIRSRTSGDTAGAEMEVHGGTRSTIAPCGCPVGTTIEVRNLFFNTPVRRKFLRTTQTEMGHITEALTRIALAHDDVHFTLLHNGRTVHELAANTDWRSRIATVFGREIAESLMWVDSGDGAIRLSGYVADPAHNRSHNRMQYLFLNRRHIRDRALMHALTEAYRGLIMTGRYPIAFLRLEMPPEAVDVNVHPTKLEVRFQDSGQAYQKLLGTIRNRFLSSDLTARASLNDGPRTATDDGATLQANDGAATADGATGPYATGPHATGPHATGAAVTGQGGDTGVARPAWLNRGGPVESGGTPLVAESRLDGTSRQAESGHSGGANAAGYQGRQGELGLAFERAPLPQRSAAGNSLSGRRDDTGIAAEADATEAGRWQDAGGPGEPVKEPPQRDAWQAAARSGASGVADNFPTSARTPEGAPALQVYNRYLITEADEGVVVIDQHALHERILYEQLREKVLSETVEVQRLLVPEPVQLTPAETAAVLDRQDELRQLGLEVEPFGGDTVIVSAYPAILANLRPAEMLREIAAQLLTPEKQPERRDLIDSLLHMMSCKAAIKAGDRLTGEEVAALVQQRHVVQDAHHCPHGRPTTLIFTRDELDRRFKRI